MKLGKQYIVTKESDDGTFLVGDRISLNSDGSINCIESKGWVRNSYLKTYPTLI